jgi:hypothetical protein
VSFGLASAGAPTAVVMENFPVTDLFGQTETIKAISLWEPWATLMARGVKRHETRHWATDHRGRIAIHAAKTLDLAGAPDLLCLSLLGRDWSAACARGAVVAIGDLVACRPATDVGVELTRADQAAGNYAPGRYAWRIDRIRRLAEPIPTLGRQGLFNWSPPGDLADRLLPVEDHAALCRRIGWG